MAYRSRARYADERERRSPPTRSPLQRPRRSSRHASHQRSRRDGSRHRPHHRSRRDGSRHRPHHRSRPDGSRHRPHHRSRHGSPAFPDKSPTTLKIARLSRHLEHLERIEDRLQHGKPRAPHNSPDRGSKYDRRSPARGSHYDRRSPARGPQYGQSSEYGRGSPGRYAQQSGQQFGPHSGQQAGPTSSPTKSQPSFWRRHSGKLAAAAGLAGLAAATVASGGTLPGAGLLASGAKMVGSAMGSLRGLVGSSDTVPQDPAAQAARTSAFHDTMRNNTTSAFEQPTSSWENAPAPLPPPPVAANKGWLGWKKWFGLGGGMDKSRATSGPRRRPTASAKLMPRRTARPRSRRKSSPKTLADATHGKARANKNKTLAKTRGNTKARKASASHVKVTGTGGKTRALSVGRAPIRHSVGPPALGDKFLVFTFGPTGSGKGSKLKCLVDALNLKFHLRPALQSSDMAASNIDDFVEGDATYKQAAAAIVAKHRLTSKDVASFTGACALTPKLVRMAAQFQSLYYATRARVGAVSESDRATLGAVRAGKRLVLVETVGAWNDDVDWFCDSLDEYLRLARSSGYKIGIFYPRVELSTLVRRNMSRFQQAVRSGKAPRLPDCQFIRKSVPAIEQTLHQLVARKCVDFVLEIDNTADGLEQCDETRWRAFRHT